MDAKDDPEAADGVGEDRGLVVAGAALSCAASATRQSARIPGCRGDESGDVEQERRGRHRYRQRVRPRVGPTVCTTEFTTSSISSRLLSVAARNRQDPESLTREHDDGMWSTLGTVVESAPWSQGNSGKSALRAGRSWEEPNVRDLAARSEKDFETGSGSRITGFSPKVRGERPRREDSPAQPVGTSACSRSSSVSSRRQERIFC